jgi:DNA-binding NarL/FixJ family response regulator
LDFTSLLPQVRDDTAVFIGLLRGVRLVLCLASPAQITLLMGSPARILGAATTEAEGLSLVQAHRPDLLFVSDRLEEGCGVELVVGVKRLHPQVRTVLMVTGERRCERIRLALEAGCEGILLESHLVQGSGLRALSTVLSGGMYLDRALGSAVRSRSRPFTGDRPERLSAREREVLSRLVRGERNSEIAQALMVSVDTVKSHVRNLLLKLQARDRTHAAVIGLRRGLVEWPDP